MVVAAAVLAAGGSALGANRLAPPPPHPVLAVSVTGTAPPSVVDAAPDPTPPGTTQRVSVGSDGRQGNAISGAVNQVLPAARGNQAISADGRWVAFASSATNLIAGSQRPPGGIYLRDRQAGTTIAIPWTDGGAFPAGVTGAEPAISADGSVVAFTAVVTASGQAGGPVGGNPTPYVLAWDRGSGTTSVVSLDPRNQPTPGWQPSISADGRYVAYTQWAIDTTPPVLSDLSANPKALQPGPCGPTSSTISVTATDPDDAVSSVTLTYAPSGGTATSEPMSPAGGGIWTATITLGSGWNTGQVSYSVQATDSHGNTSAALAPDSANELNVDVCIA